MTVFVKYLVLIVGFIGAVNAIQSNHIASAIVSAGAFIAYALIEIQDLKIINKEDINE
jgi:hypothetical protein